MKSRVTTNFLINTWIWVVGAAVLLTAMPSLINSRMVMALIVYIAILGLFATSLNLLIGYTGLVSFGHGMFYGSGAYGFGILMQTGQWSVSAAMAVAVLGSALLALVVGVVCIRTKEIYFAFLTLAIQMMFYSTILSWKSLTGGDQGLMGGFQKSAIFGLNLANPDHAYYFITVVVVLALGLLWHITKSPFGYALRMIRDNASRVEFLGMNVRGYRLTAFIIASAFGGLAGALMSLYVSSAYPNFANWPMSAQGIFVIMLGGINTFLGPMAGAVVLTLLNHFVTEYTKFYGLVLGAIILFYVLALRKGLLDVVLEHIRHGVDRRRQRTKSKLV